MWFLTKIKNKWRWQRVLFTGLRQLLECKTLLPVQNAKMQSLGHRATAFPTLCIGRTSRLSITIKLLYFCASQPAALSSEDFSQLFPSSPLLCFIFLRTPFFHCLYLLNSLCWALTAAGYLWQWRERLKKWMKLSFPFLRKCCLYYEEEAKVIKP